MASEREAARDAVIAAIRELFAPAPVSWSGWVAGKFLRGYDADLADKVKAALTLLDALPPEPPEGAEPELPPRGVAWREMMARVDHEGGC